MRKKQIVLIVCAMIFIFACAAKKPSSVTLAPAKPRPYRFEQRWATVNGIKISYIDEGPKDAPAVVFIHGLGGALDNWDYNVPVLKAKYRCIAIDLPGFGNSEQKRDFPYTIAWNSDIVVAFIRQLGLQKASLVGNSMGGHVSAYTAIVHPEFVDRLVLVDAAGTIKATGSGKMVVKHLDFVENIIMKKMNKELKKGPDVFQKYIVTQVKNSGVFYDMETPEVKDFLNRMFEMGRESAQTDWLPQWIHAMVALGSSIAMTPLNNRLKEINAPTLIWWGANDTLGSVELAQIYHKGIAGSFLLVEPKCGHMGQVEKPKEFNRAVDRFLCGCK